MVFQADVLNISHIDKRVLDEVKSLFESKFG